MSVASCSPSLCLEVLFYSCCGCLLLPLDMCSLHSCPIISICPGENGILVFCLYRVKNKYIAKLLMHLEVKQPWCIYLFVHMFSVLKVTLLLVVQKYILLFRCNNASDCSSWSTNHFDGSSTINYYFKLF